jgi:hypothetical protein
VRDAGKDARDCLVFVGTHCLLAVALVHLFPADPADIWHPFATWGRAVSAVLPSVPAFADFVTFPAPASCTLVALWTLLPLSAWWVSRGDWVIPTPNYTLLRRRPWILLLLAALFIAIVIGFAVVTSMNARHGRAGRALESIRDGQISFGSFMGLKFSAMAIGIGVLPKLLRIAREVTSDDARQSAGPAPGKQADRRGR